MSELKGPELVAHGELPSVVDVLERSGVVASKSAARRAIAEGGAYLNNERVADPEPGCARPTCCTAGTPWSVAASGRSVLSR